MDKVLILTETIGGSGHFRAALSLRRGLNRIAPRVHVDIMRGLPRVSPQLEVLARKVYLNTLQYAPGLWGAAYSREEGISDTFRTSLGKILSTRLQSFVEELRPQVVVCTHAFCLGAMGVIKERSSHRFRLGAAITDFDVNGFWVHPNVDFFLVAHETVANKIRNRFGMRSAKVYPTGSPIEPEFSQPLPDKKELRAELGLFQDPFTILVMGGGVGLGPMEECIEQFRLDMPDAQVIVVTGKNTSLQQQLVARYQGDPLVHVKGFVNRMARWMGASDLIVSKPGGMTSSEALAAGLPMVICCPLPGQEERNSHFLLQHQVALRQDSPEQIPSFVYPLRNNPTRWEVMSKQALRLGRPKSALRGSEIVLDYFH